MAKFKTREEWLVAANKLIDKQVFKQAGHSLPRKLRLSCAFPSKSALGQKKRRIGECWPSAATSDKYVQIFISPLIDDPIRALDILVHEDVHAVDDCKNGHKGPFTAICRSIGLTEGKPTQAAAGPELLKVLRGIRKELGAYPHRKLNPSFVKKQTQSTRLIKCMCPDTGYVVRTTQKWIDEYGPPLGPNGDMMEVC